MTVKSVLAALAMVLCGAPALAERPMLEFRLGVDVFTRQQSAISGLNGMSILYTTDTGFYGGASIYSAAFGSGGGFFVGGWELGKTTHFGDNLFWDAGVFIGGGGGASQVGGDGLMLRPQVQLGYDFGAYRLGVGASWVSVSGSAISTPAFALTYTRPLRLELVHGAGAGDLSGGDRIATVAPLARMYLPQGNLKRGGVPLQAMQLVGAEITFVRAPSTEVFIQASGVVSGDAEGYADWVLGKRYLWDVAPFRLYADFGAGIGGGGAVDTGGGLIAVADIGVRLKTGDRLSLDAGVGVVRSINGDFLAVTPTAKLALAFGGGGARPGHMNWQINTGFTQLAIGPDFRKSGGAQTAAPGMIEVDIDVFLRENLYLTGQAFTAITGQAGGFQIGLFGAGYRVAMNDRWSVSGEVLLGAAGGAGVDTQGGFIGGYKGELDYALSDKAILSLGVGQLRTLKGGGMQPVLMSLGMKFPFTTLH